MTHQTNIKCQGEIYPSDLELLAKIQLKIMRFVPRHNIIQIHNNVMWD